MFNFFKKKEKVSPATPETKKYTFESMDINKIEGKANIELIDVRTRG